MTIISFMTANYVARPVGYNMTEGWMQGDNATNAHFRPLETFAGRFEEYLLDVKQMGFEALDIWLAILHPEWATADHIAIAQDLLAKHDLTVTSLAGGFGDTPEALERSCKLAAALNTSVLGGFSNLHITDRSTCVGILKQYGAKLALENHPEKTPEEMLGKIGDGGDGTIGTAVDTGWYGTQGYDAAQAIEKLDGYLFIVHLKDVMAAGGHESCRLGQGAVPVEACVQTLKKLGYQGAISIEHEPDHYDPTEDCIASLKSVQGWLAS